MNDTAEMTIAALRQDRKILRDALVKIIGADDATELVGMKKALDAMRTLGMAEPKNLDSALAGIQALLDTDHAI